MRVTEHRLHRWQRERLRSQGPERVPQIVEAQLAQSGGLQCGVVPRPKLAVVLSGTVERREDQITRATEPCPSRQAVERDHYLVGHRDAAYLPALGLDERLADVAP